MTITVSDDPFSEDDRFAAHVKSVVINKDFRGLGLARVLYIATLATLEEKKVQRLYLEAEEDSSRYGKLVDLYQKWGFHELSNAQILVLYNGNDSLRKVPMVSVFQKSFYFPRAPMESVRFCMLALQTPDGSYLVAEEDGKLTVSAKSYGYMWQTMLGATGEICLRSVHGKFLCVEEDGTILANRRASSTWETFQVVPHGDKPAMDISRGVALRTYHGGFLNLNVTENRAEVSKDPVSWDGSDMMKLICNKNPKDPLFEKIMRKYQTTAFVQAQYAKYGALQHARMSILKACKCVMELAGDSNRDTSWVMKYMLASAGAVKQDGHPDWMQLLVFLRALGMVFLCWTDDENAVLRSISAQEWLRNISTWVVGERISSSIDFPELTELNADCSRRGKRDNALNQGKVDDVLLTWTPDEYLYRVLSMNTTSLPVEALDIIRFWSFKASDSFNKASEPQDVDMMDWIASVGKIARVPEQVVQSICVNEELPYYLLLAEKYLPDALQW
ncbi:hypothetical protein CCR75_000782 [Bremia lactucae]|uniref:Inositol oxygenase n=1 Tax=Bremia lactucae TaxID=4779 RepID=A0A976NY40_BRELC|nr:hypothetical protein CCR75_000782 [Bremia lactucae]